MLTLHLTLTLILTLTLSEHNAFLWRPVNYNLANEGYQRIPKADVCDVVHRDKAAKG